MLNTGLGLRERLIAFLHEVWGINGSTAADLLKERAALGDPDPPYPAWGAGFWE